MKKLMTFWRKDDAVAAVEAGILFPIMITLLLGMIDMGALLVANMKVTNASQTVSDLLGREISTNTAAINDAIVAGRLSLAPYSTASYGVDIVGIQYVGQNLTPTVRWRETSNMEPNDNVIQRSAGMGLEGEGVIAVTVQYTFQPSFYTFLVSDLLVSEESFVRGRKGNFVARL
jgi:Flp pilus assembly protein TadG